MPMIQAKDRDYLTKEFAAKLTGPVKLVMVTQEHECQFCKETRQLVEELAELSDKITAEVYDFVADADKIASYGIDKIPAIAVIGAKDYGIRFYGIPSGYECMSLLDAIQRVSAGDSGLNDASRALLAGLESPLALQVFVTPT